MGGRSSVADPDNPQEVGEYNTDDLSLSGVAISGNFAFAIDESDGYLFVVSVANPESAAGVGLLDIGGFLNEITVSGDYAYIAGRWMGLHIVSVADLEHPEEIGYFDAEWIAKGIEVSGDYVYIADYGEGRGRNVDGVLHIISVADPEQPVLLSSFHPDSPVVGVTISGDIAYIAASDSGMYVVSIADKERPEQIGHFEALDGVSDIVIVGDYAYVANLKIGLSVISISDPENLVEVGYYDTPGVAYGVDLSEEGLIYVADASNMGIYRFTEPNAAIDPSITAPAKYKLYSSYPNPFNSQTRIAHDLQVSTNVKLSILDQGMRTLGQHHLI